ncbi:MAG: type VI secretion system tube protein Hcp [Thermodesulfobacteriota bacterium]|nr:type VI secretion system tube protein Hcp [Thermodesulfobacteriota bacterium]
MKTISIILAACCLFFFSFSCPAYSAINAFLEIDGIDGESEDPAYEDWIDIVSWSWQISNPNANSRGSGSGAAIVRPLIVTKYIDKASPAIALSVLLGKAIQDAKLVLKKPGTSYEHFRIEMTDVLIANVAPSGNLGDDRTIESVALVFSRICYVYIPENISNPGAPGAEIRRCFDIEKNAEI